ncbi:MAG TPA: ABC transporter permease [Azospirillaceae bacterium]|nr:ABC transporter permease [Azospirillaceae bacterium]
MSSASPQPTTPAAAGRAGGLTDLLLGPVLLPLRHGLLVRQMTRRAVEGRYRNSGLGLLWSLATPAALILVYTFVFHSIFKMRWQAAAGDDPAEFGIVLFAGLIMFWLFADTATRAPDLVVERATYVKRVVFPLEILPFVNLGSALFHWAVSFLVLLGAMLVVGLPLPPTILYVPLLLAPLCLVLLGISWLLAGIGVFVRDLGHVVGLLTTLMMFLAPIFYPLASVPEEFRGAIQLNPLTFIVEQARAILIFGHQPDFMGLARYAAAGWLVAVLGLFTFRRLRSGFADVL